MRHDAICLRCGETKRRPYETCEKCGFDPTRNEDDLVKSVYLSLGRFEGEEEQARYESELQLMGRAIREGGEVIDFDPVELSRLKAQKHIMEGNLNFSVVGVLFKLFRPAFIFLGILCILLLILFLLRR